MNYAADSVGSQSLKASRGLTLVAALTAGREAAEAAMRALGEAVRAWEITAENRHASITPVLDPMGRDTVTLTRSAPPA